ncbi:Hydrogenase expression/formation protein HoxQ [Paraburkholderia ribeironis]|uniref:Hydrogenase expression/formation protein HoxQ n=1 Tax=Paraburkholderia ribeironis TaxID=1247936 RepID=A0A1N7RSY6_9BURK|nr:hydrogenase expression/formation protein [Paraburkholderia ribeironis]SIT38240.1 Hydrogenase expression/formation protein HoxQ [Paraburkholderia ribeironis]
MPLHMSTFNLPPLPKPEPIAANKGAEAVLKAVYAALATAGTGGPNPRIDLSGLDGDDRTLLSQILSEGEVSARIDGQSTVLIQESVFAGVWRVVEGGPDTVQEYVEIGVAPTLLTMVSRERAHAWQFPDVVPDEVTNAASILTEIGEHLATWQHGQPSHVVNLTLLPLSPPDVAFLDQVLGWGAVTILSRGYGNCRVTTTNVPYCWRAVYFNSEDTMILNTIEVTDLPNVVCAAPDDLRDSRERLHDVLNWVAIA